MYKSINFRIFILLGVFYSTSASALLIDNGISTTDTTTNLVWLKATQSTGQSYNTVSSQFGAGGLFEGWRYATLTEYQTFLSSNFGVNIADGTSVFIGSTTDSAIISALGDTGLGSAESRGIINHLTASNQHRYAFTGNSSTRLNSIINDTRSSGDIGSYLVRPVPLPPAAILMVSGLVGLFGFSKKKIKYHRSEM